MGTVSARNRRGLMGGTFEKQVVTGDLRLALAYKARFSGITFRDCQMEKGNWSCGIFEDCRFESCSLDLSNFNASTFRRCEFVNCTLDLATFQSCILEDVGFIMGRAEYTDFWNATLRRVKFDIQLHGADLRFAAAKDLDYGDSNMWGASINVNCVAFVDKEGSERHIQIMLALLASTRGNDELRAKIAELVEPHYLQMVSKMIGEKK